LSGLTVLNPLYAFCDTGGLDCLLGVILIVLYKSVAILIFTLFYPPAKTLGLPAATLVQPDIASPILPVPLPFVKTVVDPTAIGAA
jgi:hypothetical protein